MDTANIMRPDVPTTLLALKMRAIRMSQDIVKIFVENGNDLLGWIEKAKESLAVDHPSEVR